MSSSEITAPFGRGQPGLPGGLDRGGTDRRDRRAAVVEPACARCTAPDRRAGAAKNGRRALKAFLRNPNAIFGLTFLALVTIGALIAPLIYPTIR